MREKMRHFPPAFSVENMHSNYIRHLTKKGAIQVGLTLHFNEIE